jgi:hypothetical protein
VVLMPAVIGFAVLNGLFVAGMTVLARRAWRVLPPGAPVPVHAGVRGWDSWSPKERALVLWPAIAGAFWLANLVILVLVAAAVIARSPTDRGSVYAAAAGLTVPLVILLVSERRALHAARTLSQQGTARPDGRPAP